MLLTLLTAGAVVSVVELVEAEALDAARDDVEGIS